MEPASLTEPFRGREGNPMTTSAGNNRWRPGCACCAGAPATTRRSFLAGIAALGAASGSGFLASLTGASAQGALRRAAANS